MYKNVYINGQIFTHEEAFEQTGTGTGSVPLKFNINLIFSSLRIENRVKKGRIFWLVATGISFGLLQLSDGISGKSIKQQSA